MSDDAALVQGFIGRGEPVPPGVYHPARPLTPPIRELILSYWEKNGAWLTPGRLAPWLGRTEADVRQEMERMEGEGLAERWREQPGDEWRFGPPRKP